LSATFPLLRRLRLMDRRSLYKIAQACRQWTQIPAEFKLTPSCAGRISDPFLILDFGPSPISGDRSYDCEGSELSFP
jgi:hypothetical protein